MYDVFFCRVLFSHFCFQTVINSAYIVKSSLQIALFVYTSKKEGQESVELLRLSDQRGLTILVYIAPYTT